ncbi:hypothetical protein M422DRAFT_246095 [Sphaerobolus stellatus SS14]|nr:hypothetical protein M422DRAFT_246095 [Sphaerobolus stellatus SS14]
MSNIRVLEAYHASPMTLFLIGAGLSAHPASSEDCQLLTAAAVASSIATRLKDSSLATTLT